MKNGMVMAHLVDTDLSFLREDITVDCNDIEAMMTDIVLLREDRRRKKAKVWHSIIHVKMLRMPQNLNSIYYYVDTPQTLSYYEK